MATSGVHVPKNMIVRAISILGILSFRAKKDAVFITISEDLIIAQKLIKRKSIFKIVLSRLSL